LAKTSPDYFITLREPRGNSRPAAFKTGGVDADLRWHIRQSVSDAVAPPVRYRSNYPSEEELPEVLEHNHMLVVSQSVREAIEPWLKDYEFIPVEVERSLTDAVDSVGGGEVVAGYWWLNSWRLLDLIDWDQSSLVAAVTPNDPADKYSNAPLKVNHWERLHIKPGLLGGEHFYGVKYVRGARRYISPELHQHLLKQKFRLSFGVHPLAPLPGGMLAAIEHLNGAPE
jgi:hypothetical protein